MHKLMRRLLHSHRDGEQGQMAVLMVLIVIVVFMFFALALDAGLWYFDHRTAQNQVDAAVLAGARELPNATAAENTAATWLQRNGADPNDIDESCSSTFIADEEDEVDSLELCIRRSSPGLFAKLAGIEFATVSARAKAVAMTQTVPYAIFALSEDDCQALYVFGTADIAIAGGGGTYSRSDCQSNSLDVQGNSTLTSGMNDVRGGASYSDGSVSPPPDTGFPYIEDPFLHVPVPPRPATTCANNATTLSPCRFTGSRNVSNTITLNAGVYYIEGNANQGISLVSSGRIQANGPVIIYITCTGGSCNPGQVPAAFTMAGQSSINLVGHPDYDDIIFFVDRNAGMPQSGQARVDLAGGGEMTISGVIYAPSTRVRLVGNSSTQNNDLNAAIFADTIDTGGTSDITFTYLVEVISPIRLLALVE